MSLTVGSGPLAPACGRRVQRRAYRLPETVLFFDPYLPRVRALFEGETVADSLATKLLHESGRSPVFYFPLDDVRTDLLEPAGTSAEVLSEGGGELPNAALRGARRARRRLALRVPGRSGQPSPTTSPSSGRRSTSGSDR